LPLVTINTFFRLGEQQLKEYYYSDQEFMADIKQRGIILALDEYIKNMRNTALREAILSRYIVVNELSKESYENYFKMCATDADLFKYSQAKYSRVQKYWPDVVKDNIVSRVKFFLIETLQEYSRYYYHDVKQIFLALDEL
jgi:hypothetical protein